MIKGPLGIWEFPILNNLVSRAAMLQAQNQRQVTGETKEVQAENGDGTVVVREVERVETPVEREQDDIIFPTEEGTEKQNRSIPVERADRDETVFIEQKDVVLNSRVDFEPSTVDIEGERISSPIKGDGFLKSFLVVVDSDQFDTFLEVDNSNIVREPYTELAQVTNELENISAYQKNGDYVISMRDYPFRQFVSAGIKPKTTPITVKRVRMEVER